MTRTIFERICQPVWLQLGRQELSCFQLFSGFKSFPPLLSFHPYFYAYSNCSTSSQVSMFSHVFHHSSHPHHISVFSSLLFLLSHSYFHASNRFLTFPIFLTFPVVPVPPSNVWSLYNLWISLQAGGPEDKPFTPGLNNQTQPNVTKNNHDNRKYYQTHHLDDMKVLSTRLSLYTFHCDTLHNTYKYM